MINKFNFGNFLKKLKLPSSFTILLFITLILIMVTWIPGVLPENGKKLGVIDVFRAPMKAFALESKASIIVFILVLGGFLNIIIESKVLDATFGRLMTKLKNKEFWIIPVVMISFSIGGTVYGMGEETIALYPILIPIMLAAKFDILTAVMTILLGAGIGCVGSIINPFSIGVAVNTSKEVGSLITLQHGIILRLISWFVLTGLTTGFVVWYALRIQKFPEKSYLFNKAEFYNKEFAVSQEVPEFNVKRKIILGIFITVFVIMIATIVYPGKNYSGYLTSIVPGLMTTYEPFGAWYFLDLAALFFLASIIIAAINWSGEEKFINNFCRGASDILPVCLIIAVAAGIGVVLKDSKLQDSMTQSLKKILQKNDFASIIVLFMAFLPLSILIPSSSGFAEAVFPILGAVQVLPKILPLTITAYSFANGIINLVAPTSAILAAALMIAKVPYGAFIKTTAPLVGVIIISAIVLLLCGAIFV